MYNSSYFKNKDLEDLLVSIDLAIKRQAETKNFDETKIPKMLFLERKDYINTLTVKEYKGPFMTYDLKKRGPASISKTEFFISPHQHSNNDKRDLGNGEILSTIRKDNLIKLTVRTKRKKVLTELMCLLEEAFLFQKHIIVAKTQLKEISLREELKDDFYIMEVEFYARTTVYVSTRDDSKLENVNIRYTSPLCKYFDTLSDTCTLSNSEKKDEAYHTLCHSKTFCQQHEPLIKIQIKN